MNNQLDRDMVLKCYNGYLNQIRELEEKRQAAMDIQNPVGEQLVKTIDSQLLEMKKELAGLQYALDNMT